MKTSSHTDSTTRFSDRVENYIKYRPGYPKEMMNFLVENKALLDEDIVADIGSGTGISTKLFLENGNLVYGIEPNDAMRNAAENLLVNFPNFRSINATAERTGLPVESVDLIVAGQAFHWFDVAKTKEEWLRILKPGGRVALIWNERLEDATPFLNAYELLLRKYGTDYQEINHKNIDSKIIAGFFKPATCNLQVFANSQHFDLEGLKGRLLSSSYTPGPEKLTYIPMIDTLKDIFDKYNEDGKVVFEYKTMVYYRKMK